MSAPTPATMNRVRCDRVPAWAALQAAANKRRDFDLRTAFAADAGRFERFSLSAPHVFADLSKNLIDDHVQALLLELAQQCGVAAHRDAMLQGWPSIPPSNVRCCTLCREIRHQPLLRLAI